MNRMGFLWARMTGGEAALMRLSAPLAVLLAELDDRHVALVGNAHSLSARREGVEIDGTDLVIRINAAPLPSPGSHGTRTDWLAMSMAVDRATLAARAPRRAIWMPTTRRRLPWHVARHPGFVLNPRGRNAELRVALGAPPTTGLMLIDLLARSSIAGARLHGFDFFASGSLSGRRTAKDVPHDFAAERAFVEELLERDRRFRLNP
jgi:hypothetical protein